MVDYFELDDFSDVLLPTLEETMNAILKDQIVHLMDYQRVIARFPIADSSIQVAILEIVGYQKALRASQQDLTAFQSMIEKSQNTMGMIAFALFERYGEAIQEAFGETIAWLMKANRYEYSQWRIEAAIRLVS